MHHLYSPFSRLLILIGFFVLPGKATRAQSLVESMQKLNQYLKNFDSGYYGYFEMADGYIWLRFKSGNYNKFRMEDMEGAVIQEQYQRVIFKCRGDQKCISTDWKPNGREDYTQFLQGYQAFDYEVLARLLNQFRDAYLKENTKTEDAPPRRKVMSKNANARIIDPGKTYTTIVRVKDCLDWSWATEAQKAKADEENWNGYVPSIGDEGEVVFKTVHCDTKIKILILKVGENYVPIAESAVIFLK